MRPLTLVLAALGVFGQASASPLFAEAANSFIQAAQRGGFGAAPNSGTPNSLIPSITSSSSSSSSSSTSSSTGTPPSSSSSSGRPSGGRTPIFHTCNDQGTFAITFDDGVQPTEGAFAKLLSDNGAKGTFFVNGYNWGCIYDEQNVQLLRATYAAGHEIGSHTWDHPHAGNLTYQQFDQQLALVEEALGKILGIKPALYRPPFGEISNSNTDVLTARGYSGTILWDDVSGPGTGTSVPNSVAMYLRRAAQYPQPHMVLNHEQDASSLTQVLPQAIAALKSHGYRLVTVSECLGIPAYQSVGAPSQRDSTWTCRGRPLPGAP